MAAARASELLENFVDRFAAPLRLPENAAHLASARERLPAAMDELARTLTQNDLVVVEMERQVSKTFEDALAMRGAVDLIARDRNGRCVIIDLKWTRNAKRRLEELEDGNAIQLATYGAMVADGAPYQAGYFLLNQRQFATLAEGGLVGRQVEGSRDFPETWKAAVQTWRELSEIAEAGELVARGVEGWEDSFPEDLPIMREVKCRRCDYQTLCRVRGID